MILRRITEHVKAQNWFAVGLDFFIVVVGVLSVYRFRTGMMRERIRRADKPFWSGYRLILKAMQRPLKC